MSDSRRWTTLSTQRLIERWWMTLRVDKVQLPHGPVLDEYHVVEYPDWACVIALTSTGDAVMVEQYRYGIDRMSLECPAGAIDEGEDPLVAARRELLEETGYVSDEWTSLGALAIEPSRHTNHGHIFIAQNVRRVAAQSLDASEDITTHLVSAASLPERIRAGEIIHGVHVAAVFWAMQRGWILNEG